MKKTEPGTRALIREYLRCREANNLSRSLAFETEMSKRIGPGNAVLVDGKIISAHKGDIEGKMTHWTFVHNRIGLDEEDNKMPIIYGPLDNVEEDEEELAVPPQKEKESKVTRVRRRKVPKDMV